MCLISGILLELCTHVAHMDAVDNASRGVGPWVIVIEYSVSAGARGIKGCCANA